MKNNFLLLVASSIVLSIAFLQCAPSATTNPEATTQTDAVRPMPATEPQSIAKPIPVVEPIPIAKLTSIDQPILIDKPAPIAEPISVDKPAAIAKPILVKEPAPIAKPIPADKPAAVAKPIPADKAAPIAKPIPIDKAAPIAKPIPIEEPAPVTKPIPVEESATIAEPKSIAEPTPIAKPIPVEKPVSLMTAGFTLKLLKATIEGTSTLHAWESQVTEITGKGSFQTKDNLLASIQDAEIKITVEGIKSKEGKKMDNKTYEAFNSDENPFIIYSFSNAVVNTSASHVVTIDVAGNLSMAGTTKPVSLSANGKELPNGDLQLTVSKKIKMTDYNMKPPVMLLGTIKVGDEITVSFDFELTKLQK